MAWRAWLVFLQVVSGSIAGELQSPHNPQNRNRNAGERSAKEDACAFVIATIAIGPRGLTNNSYPSFAFSSEWAQDSSQRCPGFCMRLCVCVLLVGATDLRANRCLPE